MHPWCFWTVDKKHNRHVMCGIEFMAGATGRGAWRAACLIKALAVLSGEDIGQTISQNLTF
jgi:hypothetical protein